MTSEAPAQLGEAELVKYRPIKKKIVISYKLRVRFPPFFDAYISEKEITDLEAIPVAGKKK